jgi:lipopolysaccharide export system protein LptA
MSLTEKSIAILIATALLGAIATTAHAERADRDKPANLEADRVTMDDAKKISVFEGNVQLTQGTLLIRADKLVVTQDAQGFQLGIATAGPGGLAHFRQKREGKEEYVDGDAERIEHDGRAEKTLFFNRAHVKSGLDEVRGNYVAYDAKTENYLVTNGASTNAGTTTSGQARSTTSGTTSAGDSRVRAVIQPKNREAKEPLKGVVAPARAADPVPLKTSPDMTKPRQE